MYRVEWLQAALDELARIWMHANSELRQVITVASDRLDQQLQANPLGNSQASPGRKRACFVGPLGVSYRLEEDNATVTVLHIWLILPYQRNGD